MDLFTQAILWLADGRWFSGQLCTNAKCICNGTVVNGHARIGANERASTPIRNERGERWVVKAVSGYGSGENSFSFVVAGAVADGIGAVFCRSMWRLPYRQSV
jgi:hypothetical protein